MLGRNAVLFSHAPQVMTIVAIVGVLTALMAATIGLVQYDIKRVLAYSTVSQLGYMFLAMGVGAYAAGVFHLYTHAFFKALLFLGSGAVIHALHGEQDIRHMGGLKKDLPITYWTFLIGAIAIAGVPPLAGFFSKDEILFKTFTHGNTIMWAIGVATAFLTATYMFRLVFLTFHGERRQPPAAHGAHGAADHGHGHAPAGHLHDAPPAMALALIVLAAGSVLAGFVGVPHILGGGNRIERFLEPAFEAHAMAPATEFQVAEGRPQAAPVPETAAVHEEAAAEGANEWLLMGISVGAAAAGIGLAMYFWLWNREAAANIARGAAGFYRLLLNKYYVDELYDAAIVRPIQAVSTSVLWKGADAALIDGSVNGVGQVVQGTSSVLRRLQSGSIRAYAASLFLGVVLILGWYLFR
jgi:NADH-quinone oxidoreductase subunit L